MVSIENGSKRQLPPPLHFLKEYPNDVDKGEITGVPAGLQVVSEMEALSYTIGLTDGVNPTSKVVIRLETAFTNPEFNCTVVPVNITIYANDNGTVTPISIRTSGNVIDEGTDTLAYSYSVLEIKPFLSLSITRKI